MNTTNSSPSRSISSTSNNSESIGTEPGDRALTRARSLLIASAGRDGKKSFPAGVPRRVPPTASGDDEHLLPEQPVERRTAEIEAHQDRPGGQSSLGRVGQELGPDALDREAAGLESLDHGAVAERKGISNLKGLRPRGEVNRSRPPASGARGPLSASGIVDGAGGSAWTQESWAPSPGSSGR